VVSRMARVSSRIACWPFVTEYKLHMSDPQHSLTPRPSKGARALAAPCL
jgi:hypothetical protein